VKIRAAKFFSEETLSDEELESQLSSKLEEPIGFPLEISNNECSQNLGRENSKEDSPLSFILKYKMSFLTPPNIPIGLMGFRIPDYGFSNKKVPSKKAKFISVNANHFDLMIRDRKEFDKLVFSIQGEPGYYQRFDVGMITQYVFQTLADPEWIKFYANEPKWAKFKSKALVARFKNKHCPLEHSDLQSYAAKGHLEFEDDLRFLYEQKAVTDTDKVKLLQKLFPAIYR
jgi:hypothetical protein